MERGTDLTITFYLTETILQEDQVQVVVSQQGLVTQQLCQQLVQGAAGAAGEALSGHMTDTGAHSSLFAQKAAVVHTHPASKVTSGTLGGQVSAYPNTNYTNPQVRSIVLSTGEPSGGGNGQLWVQYEE